MSQCLPKQILSFYGYHNQLPGPNCFNLALMMAGLVPGLRYTDPHEISETLSSPLCQELQEAPRPGFSTCIKLAKTKPAQMTPTRSLLALENATIMSLTIAVKPMMSISNHINYQVS